MLLRLPELVLFFLQGRDEDTLVLFENIEEEDESMELAFVSVWYFDVSTLVYQGEQVFVLLGIHVLPSRDEFVDELEAVQYHHLVVVDVLFVFISV